MTRRIIHICDKKYLNYLYRGYSLDIAEKIWNERTPKGYIMEIFEEFKVIEKRIKK